MNRMFCATRFFVTSASGALALPVLVAFGLVLLGVPIAAQAQSTVTYLFCVYDTGVEDHDRIDVTVDGDEIFSDQELFHAEHCASKRVRLRVATDLTVKALNTGDRGENTAALVIRNAYRDTLAKREWSLKLDEPAFWIIWAISEDEVRLVAPDDPPVFPGDNNIPDQHYVENVTIGDVVLLSQAIGGTPPLSYDLQPNLPVGLSFDPMTRVLSGTPTEPSPARTYTYTATDSDGRTAQLRFEISVEADERPMFRVGTGIPDPDYVQNRAIADLTLPAVTGGDAPVVYDLSPSLPDGLTFDAANRTLSGTPTTVSPPRTYTYTATGADGQSDSLSFAIAVSPEGRVILSATELLVVEGEDGIYSVRLNSRPDQDVLVTPRNDSPHIGFDPASLIFNTNNWNTLQQISFEIEEENQHDSLTIEHTVSGYGDVTAGGDVTVHIAQRPPASDHQRETVHETVAAVAAATVSNVTSNIGARFSAPTGGATVNLAGTPVAFGPASSKSSGSVWLPDRFDVRTGDTWQARHSTMTVSDFLPSTSFEIALGASAGDKDLPIDASNRLTVWGRGDFQIFKSGGGRKSGYDGDLLAGYLGADLAMDGGWLVGLAISRIAAKADYTLGRAGGGGTLEAALTNVHPYVRVAIGAKTEAWAILGLGTGEITNVTQQTTSKTDMSMKMVSAGGRHGIASGGGVDLAILADGSSAVVETDAGVQAIDGISANVWRARLGAEASYTIDWDDGSALTSFLEVAGRKDGGDSTRGVGLEISPGLAFSHPESGLAVEARGRVLALHSADNHQEYGASITVSKAPSAGGLGLSMAITPILGTPDGTLNAASAPLFPAKAADRLSDSLSLNARLAYGVAVGKGVLAPFADFSLRDSDSRRIRIGSRYSFGPSVEVELAGDRHESASESLEHIVQFSVRIRF